MRFTSRSLEETHRAGAEIGRLLKRGDVVALIGDLGAGKTSLVKGIAEGLGVKRAGERVTSPTFSLIHEYQGREKIFHIDWYRLEEVKDADLEMANECFGARAVTLVEWADRASGFLPERRIDIQMRHGGASTRFIQLAAHGLRYQPLVKYLRTRFGA